MQDELLIFLKQNSQTDIFFFQEVYNSNEPHEFVAIPDRQNCYNLFNIISKTLNFSTGYFCSVLDGIYGIATFMNHEIEVLQSSEFFVAKGNWNDLSDMYNRDHDRKLQWFEIKLNNKKLLIMNVHLTHRPEGKKDSKKRVKQINTIIDFMNTFDCPKILAGDFNLLPDTECIKMLESCGLRNLVKDYSIQSTRTELYKKELRFADYIFVSPEINVKEFKVLKDVVSDHAPLYLDFNI